MLRCDEKFSIYFTDKFAVTLIGCVWWSSGGFGVWLCLAGGGGNSFTKLFWSPVVLDSFYVRHTFAFVVDTIQPKNFGEKQSSRTIQTNWRNDWVICRCIQIVILPQIRALQCLNSIAFIQSQSQIGLAGRIQRRTRTHTNGWTDCEQNRFSYAHWWMKVCDDVDGSIVLI